MAAKKKRVAPKRAPVKKVTRAQRYLKARKYGPTVQATGPSGEIRRLSAQHSDGWNNIYTALGVSNRDKRTATVQCPTLLDFGDLQDLYRGDDMAARIVELFPDEMMRRGFSLFIPNDDDTADKVNERFEELEVEDRFHRAMCWSRAYGGAGIFIGANDNQPANMPLNEEAVTSVDWLTVFDCQELRPIKWYSNPEEGKFGEVEMYAIYPKSSFVTGPEFSIKEYNRAFASGLIAPNNYIHETRIIPFHGVVTDRIQLRQTLNWGDSVLIRPYEALRDFAGSFGSAANLVQDFAQAILYLHGLAEVVSGNDTDAIRSRAEAIDIGRSTLRAIMLDKEDKFERASTPVTGLPELLEKMMLRLAGASGYPVTLLFGQSPAGLQATGESDIRWFYDKVASHQKKLLRPALRKLTRLLFKDQTIEEPEAWDIRFPPLWQLSELEEAKRRLLIAQADSAWIQSQVIKPAEVAVARFSGKMFDPDLTIEEKDVEAREKTMPATVTEGTPGSGSTAAQPETLPHKTSVGAAQGNVKLPSFGIPGGEK